LIGTIAFVGESVNDMRDTDTDCATEIVISNRAKNQETELRLPLPALLSHPSWLCIDDGNGCHIHDLLTELPIASRNRFADTGMKRNNSALPVPRSFYMMPNRSGKITDSLPIQQF
jgi:hypothetical protein